MENSRESLGSLESPGSLGSEESQGSLESQGNVGSQVSMARRQMVYGSRGDRGTRCRVAGVGSPTVREGASRTIGDAGIPGRGDAEKNHPGFAEPQPPLLGKEASRTNPRSARRDTGGNKGLRERAERQITAKNAKPAKKEAPILANSASFAVPLADGIFKTSVLSADNPIPRPRQLFGDLWVEGELAMLIGDRSLGKSLLAMQIAEAVARGEAEAAAAAEAAASFAGKKDWPAKHAKHAKTEKSNLAISESFAVKLPVLYFDFQHTIRQMAMRYSADDPGTAGAPACMSATARTVLKYAAEDGDVAGEGACVPGIQDSDVAGEVSPSPSLPFSLSPSPQVYSFSPNLIRREIDAAFDTPRDKTREDAVLQAIEADIIATGAKVIVIDSLERFCGTAMTPSRNAYVLDRLRYLQAKYGLSILVVALAPRRAPHRPLGRQMMAATSRLIGHPDSVFAVGECRWADGRGYVKHLAARSSEIIHDSSYVKTFAIRRRPDNFLGIHFIGCDPESRHLDTYNDEHRHATSDLCKEYRDKEMTQRRIAERLNLSLAAVNRALHRWSPYDDLKIAEEIAAAEKERKSVPEAETRGHGDAETEESVRAETRPSGSVQPEAETRPSESVPEAETRPSGSVQPEAETRGHGDAETEESVRAETRPSESVPEAETRPSESVPEAETRGHGDAETEESVRAETRPSESVPEAETRSSESVPEAETRSSESVPEAEIVPETAPADDPSKNEKTPEQASNDGLSPDEADARRYGLDLEFDPDGVALFVEKKDPQTGRRLVWYRRSSNGRFSRHELMENRWVSVSSVVSLGSKETVRKGACPRNGVITHDRGSKLPSKPLTDKALKLIRRGEEEKKRR